MVQNSILFCIAPAVFVICHLSIVLDAQPLTGHSLKSAEEKFTFAVLIIGIHSDGTEENLCVGSLISRNQILTAASCLQKWKVHDLRVTISIPQSAFHRNKKKLGVASIKTYKDFVNDANKNKEIVYPQIGDVAIVELSIPDTEIKPARISQSTDLPSSGSFVKIVGFARKRDDKLLLLKQYGSVEILKKQLCYEQSKILAPNYKKSTWSNQLFCAQNSLSILAMDGDFGGPAINEAGDIIGITFRGRPAPEPVKILQRGQSNLLLNIGFYKDFITKYKHT